MSTEIQWSRMETIDGDLFVPRDEARAQIVRLREVERAARIYFREFDHLIGLDDYPERCDLREALRNAAG